MLNVSAHSQILPLKIDAAAAPRDGLLSNTVIDIVEHRGNIWFATSKGLSVSRDGGTTWESVTTAEGLVSSNVSAITSVGNRLWVGTNNVGPIGDGIAIFSDGVSYSDNDGASWTQINFGATGQNISKVIGGNRTPFDVTGADDQIGQDYVFFAAFAGGLLASRDGGANWRRIFASPFDSTQYVNEPVPSLINRYFSCAIDTSHTDSVFLWAGTAEGVLQYIFASPRTKFSLGRVTALARCADCADSARLFLGGTEGISPGRISGGPFVTRTTSEGLPSGGSTISAMIRFGGALIAGAFNASTSVSTGLIRSNDEGVSFTVEPFSEFFGPQRVIRDFAVVRHRLYAAFEKGGICMSADTGKNWSLFQILPANPTSAFNSANSISAIGDTVYVGTDTGFAVAYLSSSGSIDSTTLTTFPESATSSRKVLRARVQPFVELSVPGVAYWLSTVPATVAGTTQLLYSVDRGATWLNKIAPRTNEILFKGDSIILLTDLGARLTDRTTSSLVTALTIFDSLNPNLGISNDTLLTGLVSGDTLVIGGSGGVAFSPTGGRNYRVFRANTDPLRPDIVINYLAGNGLSGDFIPALGVQYHQSRPASVWVSTRPVSFGDNAVNRISFDSTGDLDIDVIVQDDFAWNFGFAGDTAFVATNTGLFQVVDTVIDTLAIAPSGGENLIDPEATFFAVRPINNVLWAGTDDGTLRYNLSVAGAGNPQLLAKTDLTTPADEVYAFPVPFSPNRGGTIDFHFTVSQAGNVTVEIYDFAMNLVARPIDGIAYAAGTYPNGSQPGRTWEGRNGKGEVVAVGTYYIKVTVNDGDPRWGQLVVIP